MYDLDLSEIYFNLYPNAFEQNGGNITLLSIKANQEDIKFEYVKSDELKVTLQEALRQGNSIVFDMEYVVAIPSMESRFGYDQTVFNLGNFYITPNLFDNDWTINEHSIIGESFTSEIAEYYVNIHAPESYTIASTGAFKEENKCYSYAARDFALFFSDQHSVHIEMIDDIQVKYYYTNGHGKYLSHFSETVQKALTLYNKIFMEYPFENLSIVFTDLGYIGGMEYSNLVFIDINSLLNLTSFELVEKEIDRLIVHEIAHQWFYNIVGNNQATEPWLDEAFATYAETLFFREYESLSMDSLETIHNDVMGRYKKGEPTSIAHSVYEYSSKYDYLQNVYVEGASFLYQLEKAIGRDTFILLLQNYINEFEFDIVNTDSFIQYWSNATEVDLSQLFSIYLSRSYVNSNGSAPPLPELSD